MEKSLSLGEGSVQMQESYRERALRHYQLDAKWVSCVESPSIKNSLSLQQGVVRYQLGEVVGDVAMGGAGHVVVVGVQRQPPVVERPGVACGVGFRI